MGERRKFKETPFQLTIVGMCLFVCLGKNNTEGRQSGLMKRIVSTSLSPLSQSALAFQKQVYTALVRVPLPRE